MIIQMLLKLKLFSERSQAWFCNVIQLMAIMPLIACFQLSFIQVFESSHIIEYCDYENMCITRRRILQLSSMNINKTHSKNIDVSLWTDTR